MQRRRLMQVVAVTWLQVTAASTALAQSAPSPDPAAACGPASPVHALVNARLVLAPGEVVERGSLLVCGQRIAAVGAAVQVPSGALVEDLQGRTVFAGFIDAQSHYGQPAIEGSTAKPSHANAMVFPEYAAPDDAPADKVRAGELRGLGFTSVLSQPSRGVFRGQATLLSTAEVERIGHARVALGVAQVLAFETNPVQSERYPVFPGGSTALVRQTLLDADWQRRHQAWQSARRGRGARAAEPALSALEGVVAGRQPLIVQGPGDLDVDRAGRIAREFGVRTVVAGNGREYRHVAALGRGLAGVIVPLDWPALPDIGDDDAALDVALEDLEHWEAAPYNTRVLAEAGVRFSLTTAGLAQPGQQFWPRLREAVSKGLDEQAALAALTTTPAAMLGVDDQLGRLAPGLRAQFVVADAGLLRLPQARIHAIWVDGTRYLPADTEAGAAQAAIAVDAAVASQTSLPPALRVPRFPAGPHGRQGIPAQPGAVVVRGATIWTQGPDGVLANADMLVEAGTIRALGTALTVPAGTLEIDARGLHLAPGIIDAHSHIAQNRGRAFTEASDVVTAEVRTQDMLDPTDISLYRQLSDGVTSALLLQGSANPIGGQAQLIKLRWGSDGDGLMLANAPAAMKFALGENAKQSNWGSGARFPLTRMGVQDVLREAFASARTYTAQQQRAAGSDEPQRRDLRLEGVADVLSGASIAHIHSYRQDEMLGFLRLAKDYAIKPVFQHAAEAYKIAPELRAAGASASTFADYWGTKMEAADGTPYAMALLTREGVLLSLNSDSTGGVVRLNHAAARAVRFGGLSEVEALDLITRNPARQLRVEQRIGTLEVGKDADFVLWSDAPLSSRAVPQQTWIDGRRYFDIASDRAEQARIDSERARLIGLARAQAGTQTAAADTQGGGQ